MSALIIPLLRKHAQSVNSKPQDITSRITIEPPAVQAAQLSKPNPCQAPESQARRACFTCKARHIKCDRTKPQCNNCLKSPGQCAGYPVEPRKRRANPVQTPEDSRQITRISPPRIQAQVDTIIFDFPDSASALYFDEFVNLVQGPWTTAVSSGDLWGVTLPQLARQNGTLRNAAMAIGALSRWHSQSEYGSMSELSVPALPKSQGDIHYFRAVTYYCRSLKLQSESSSMQSAVFLSVLLLFFERLRGNKKGALDHINHGLALIFSLLAGGDAHDQAADLGPNPAPVLGSLSDTFTHLTTQVRTVLPGKVGQGPPLPNLSKGLRSKKQTIESFMVLLSQVPNSSATPDRIPTVFSSLDEFEEYWLAARRQQTAIAPIMMEILQASNGATSNDNSAINEFYIQLLGNNKIQEFCEVNKKLMEALGAAFLPLFEKLTMTETESPTYLRAIHLRLQYLGAVVFEDPSQFLQVELLITRTPLYREYLSLAQIALRTAKRKIKNPAHQVSLQCGLAWYLLVTSLFCRDPLVRDEAVWLLKDYLGQDGLWNTRTLYLLAARNRTIEQANAVEGTADEQWKRLWRRDFVFEDGGDRILLRYLEKDLVTGKWGLVEESTDVREASEEATWTRQPLTGSGGILMGDLCGNSFYEV